MIHQKEHRFEWKQKNENNGKRFEVCKKKNVMLSNVSTEQIKRID